MSGVLTMIQTILVLTALCRLGHSSGLEHLEHFGAAGAVPVAQLAPEVPPPPVVTSASSQYFERTFNRLVVAPPVLEAVPFAQVPSVIHVAPSPPVVQPVTKTVTTAPTQNVPVEPNVAVAVATAHAAAPIATILLPPYPFIPPNAIGFVPPTPPINVPDEDRKEATTPTTTTITQNVPREPEPTTPIPLPSNTANSFAQAPSNQNVQTNQAYGVPQLPQARPHKLKTSVEIVPVPLQYIAPPPVLAHLHHHHHGHHPHHGHHSHAHIHTFIPSPARLILRPVKVRRVRVPVKLVRYRPLPARNNARLDRETEPTTFNPVNRPVTKPPKL